MSRFKGAYPKGKAVTLVAAAMCVGLTVPVAQAASVIDLPLGADNTLQANAGGDTVQPQFALWPLTGPNTAAIHYESNDATGRGAATGGSWLLGNGTGNVIQLSTGGNAVVPQVAVGTNNDSNIVLFGNWAQGNGDNATSVTGGQVLGHVVDGNGNLLQVEFLQGNVINPQLALLGDNNAIINTQGNDGYDNGDGSSAASAGALAFVDGNGNVVQLVILSHNVINPQVSVGGSNSLAIFAGSNAAADNGNNSSVGATGFSGILAVTTSTTGSGNVTQIAILSNNVWAPQIVLPGPDGTGGTNTGQVTTDTNAADENGNGSTTTLNPVPRPTPVIDALRTVVSPLTGGKTPVLDAVQNAVQSTNGAQIGSGNINQQAPVGNSNIDNPQINLANHKTPDVVTDNTPDATTDNTPAVVESVIAKPTTLAGDNKSTGGTSAKPKWKPGDGLKKIGDAVKKALTPKPKADTP